MSRRERNKADKRARIEAAARDLFEANGFAGTTVRAIAVRAGVGTGTVLLHAESKVDLLMSLWVADLGAVVARADAEAPTSGSLADEMGHLFGVLMEWYAARPELSRVYVRETLFATPAQSAAYDALTAGFVAHIAARVERRRAELRPDVDAGATAVALFGTYLLHVVTFLRDPALGPATVPGAAEALRIVIERSTAPLLRR